MFLFVSLQWAHLHEYRFFRRGLNVWHGVHQSALKYRPITLRPFNTDPVRREDTDGGRNKTDPVGATWSQAEYPCASCTTRWEPSCCTHGLGGCEGREGWSDGPGPTGVPTGLPCQAPAAVFNVANAPSMTLTIVACRLLPAQLSIGQGVPCLFCTVPRRTCPGRVC
jgi:hypothetical protein